MYEIQCSIEFDAAHRVLDHEGKCKALHGHRYKVVFHVQSRDLNKIGMVIDFGQIRSDWRRRVEYLLDHGVILYEGDRDLGNAILAADPDTKLAYIPFPATAEGIAMFLFKDTWKYLEHDAELVLSRVDVWETPNCCGSYIPS